MEINSLEELKLVLRAAEYPITPCTEITFGLQGLDERNGWTTYVVKLDGRAIGQSDSIIV